MNKYAFALLMVLCRSNAYCCSTFCLSEEGKVVCGRNMDYRFGGGLITVNPKGLLKTAIPVSIAKPATNNAAKWISRYASVTFSLAGCELPASGMNERGLVVNSMTLHETTYPEKDSRSEVVPLQWIQYQLDTCATVDEVLATDKKLRAGKWEVYTRGHHFLVSDRSGRTAAIEFIDGETVVHTGRSLPFRALTNNTYDESVAYLRRHRGFGGEKEIERGSASLNRFVRLADTLRRNTSFSGNRDRIDYAFGILHSVAAGRNTVWSIVYEVNEQKVYYRTHVHPAVRIIDLKKLDFENSGPIRILGIDNDHDGNVSDKFNDFTTARNRACLLQCIKKEGIELDEKMLKQLDFLSRYPNSFRRASESQD